MMYVHPSKSSTPTFALIKVEKTIIPNYTVKVKGNSSTAESFVYNSTRLFISRKLISQIGLHSI